ncbi:MAG: hypothetical protein R3324_01525 [Halobacteriales archaeon]|nr:hypothetical protein [Halobacteriales archaeon]
MTHPYHHRLYVLGWLGAYVALGGTVLNLYLGGVAVLDTVVLAGFLVTLGCFITDGVLKRWVRAKEESERRRELMEWDT